MLPLVADGTLSAEDDPALFAHLAGCSPCQRALTTHDAIALALRHGPGTAARRRGTVVRLSLPWAIASAACLAAVVAIGVAVHARSAEADTPGIEVVSIPGPTPDRNVYILRNGDQTVILDPAAKAPVEGVAPVGFQRY